MIIIMMIMMIGPTMMENPFIWRGRRICCHMQRGGSTIRKTLLLTIAYCYLLLCILSYFRAPLAHTV